MMNKNRFRKFAILIMTILLIFPVSGCNNNKKDTAETTAETYLIKEHDGYVFVFKDEKSIKRTNIVLSSLPRSEKLKLEKGIEAESFEEVERIIELYES